MGKRERGRCKKQQQEEEEIKVRQQSPTMLPLAHSGEKRGGEGSLGRAPAKCVSENSQGGGGNNNSAVSLAAVCLLVHLLLPLIPTSAPSAAAAWEVPPDRFSFHILTHSFNSSPLPTLFSPSPPAATVLPRSPSLLLHHHRKVKVKVAPVLRPSHPRPRAKRPQECTFRARRYPRLLSRASTW